VGLMSCVDNLDASTIVCVCVRARACLCCEWWDLADTRMGLPIHAVNKEQFGNFIMEWLSALSSVGVVTAAQSSDKKRKGRRRRKTRRRKRTTTKSGSRGGVGVAPGTPRSSSSLFMSPSRHHAPSIGSFKFEVCRPCCCCCCGGCAWVCCSFCPLMGQCHVFTNTAMVGVVFVLPVVLVVCLVASCLDSRRKWTRPSRGGLGFW